MVRLKVSWKYAYRKKYAFQFLVVRLKAYATSIFRHTFHISIPCGSIKSSNPHSFLSLCQISIPCGSIKRYEERQQAERIPEFQFLVVRLKAPSSSRSTIANPISIPCGSIKSFIDFFLFVFFPNFNSLWFD